MRLLVASFRVGVLTISLLVDLLDGSKLVLSHLEEHLFALGYSAADTVDFKFVGVDLRLVVFELSAHLLELLSALLQVCFIFAELLSDVWSALLSQDILQLNVKLLLLLDKHVLLRHLLSLSNQTLLKTLNLLDQLVSLNVRRLKLAPSVDVEWLLELVLQVL